MKKLLSLVLATLMLLSFAACNGNGGNGGQTAEATKEPTETSTAEPTEEPKMSMEDMLSQATELTYSGINNSAPWDNIARAEMDYVGKSVTSSEMYVEKVETEYAVFKAPHNSRFEFRLYLDKTELAALQANKVYQFVGVIDGIEELKNEFTHYISVAFTIREGFIVTDKIRVTGKCDNANSEYYRIGVFVIDHGSTGAKLDLQQYESYTLEWTATYSKYLYDSFNKWFGTLYSMGKDTKIVDDNN